MPQFDQEKFNRFILDNVIGFREKPNPLKSGRLSHFYLNWRSLLEDVYTTYQVIDEFIIPFIHSISEEQTLPDTIMGVPEGASTLGSLIQGEYAKKRTDYKKGRYSFAMVRACPKEHGDIKDRYFIGSARGAVALVEDVITTGESLLKTTDRLLEAKTSVCSAIGLTNRDQLRDDRTTVQDAIVKRGVPFYSMSHVLPLLPIAYEEQKPGRKIGEAIEQEFREHGVKEIKLLK